ncbi:MAG: hypothetical protein DHS20C17_33610 [Cyclobacteriaceae bacterium]|nr:MAG: hypothetical protein DHS20C17_33610 [Cyclobacteriaceae bacterium]
MVWAPENSKIDKIPNVLVTNGNFNLTSLNAILSAQTMPDIKKYPPVSDNYGSLPVVGMRFRYHSRAGANW